MWIFQRINISKEIKRIEEEEQEKEMRDFVCAGICAGNRFRVWDVGDGMVILECVTCGWKIHLKEIEKKEEVKK